MREMMGEIKAIRKEQQKYREEIIELREENIQVRETVKTLERKIEDIEKRSKHKKIFIKGVDSGNLKEATEVENYLKSTLEVDTKIENVEVINAKMIAVKCASWKGKMSVMKNKNKLRETKVYIDSDLTKEELRVQEKLREMANGVREQRKPVKVKYHSIIVDNEIWRWDRNDEKLKKVTKN